MRTNLKKFLPLVCLPGLVLVGLWLLGRAPNQHEITSADQFPLDSNRITKPAIDPPQERFQREASEPKQVNETNESPAIKTVTLTSPDDSEDLDEIREWARQNAAAALAWALNAPGGPKRDAVAEIVCAQLAQSDPAQAVALAERFASGCSPVLENGVQQWADQDESAAYAFAANKPPGEPRDRLLSRVAFARSQKDPAAAAKLVAEEISPGEIQNEAAISVLHQWALRDTDAAMAWAQLFPAGDLRDRAMKEVENVATALAGQKPYSLDN